MKCWKCGCEILDDSLFCAECGTKIEQQEEAKVEENSTEQQENAKVEQNAEVEQSVEKMEAQNLEMNLGATTQETPMQDPAIQSNPSGAHKSKKPVGVIGIIIAAVVVVVIVVLLIAKLVGGSSNVNEKLLVYIKGSSIYYTDNMDKDKDPIRICRVDGDASWNDMELTSDGKYLYYFSETDDGASGTLCRVELEKLSNNEERNEKYMEEISSNVESYMVLEDSGVVVYRKENGKLLILDGKEEEDIAKNTQDFSITTDQEAVLYTKYNDSTGEIAYYYYNIKSGEEEKLTDALYGAASWNTTSDFIAYQSDKGEDGTELYVANTSGENEKIASNVYMVSDSDIDSRSMYYMVERNEDRNLYDYINDPYAEADGGLAEPNITDYLSEATEQEAMSTDDYNYYCVEWPEDKHYFYEWLDYDKDLELYYYYKWDKDDYGNWDGTDCYYSEVLNQWYILDEEAYRNAYEQYDGAAERIELRKELQEQTIEIVSYDLYFWEDGEEPMLVAENVLANSVWTNAKNHLAIYEKESEASISISIDDIYSASDASWQIEDKMWDTETDRERAYYCTVGETEKNLDVDEAICDMEISADGKSVVLALDESEAGEVLNLYSLSGKALEFETEIADDALCGRWVDGVYYYYKDVDDEYYGSLYRYKNGESEKVVGNVYANVTLYDDGNYYAMKDYSDYDEYDVRVYRKNGDEIEFNSISDAVYISEDRIVYIKNDALYVYRGKDEDRRVERNVDQFECMGTYGTTL